MFRFQIDLKVLIVKVTLKNQQKIKTILVQTLGRNERLVLKVTYLNMNKEQKQDEDEGNSIENKKRQKAKKTKETHKPDEEL